MISSRQHALNRAPRPRLLAAAAALCVAMVGVGQSALAAPSEAVVGQVSLLIGDARVVRKSGAVEALRRGASILVGDRVETSANGHVHVRFIDNAAVSVRPESVLEVQAYRFDADHPQSSEVRLSVEQGVSRSISGRATEVDKSRFRLNTPIAAIGVRGTDFIVQASDLGMRATVAEGAIVVGALGAGCPASGLGPCANGQTSVLSADMGRLMVEVLRSDRVARVVPAAGALVAAAGSSADDRVAFHRAAEASARSTAQLAAQPYGNNDSAAANVLTLAAGAVPNLNSPPDKKQQLAWGRYSPAEGVNDKVSVPFVLASRGREVATGDADFVLLRSRDPSNVDRQLTTNEASATFRLSRGQATFDTGTKVEAASIDRYALTLDFARRTFATALDLSSPTAGKAELRVGGDVRPDGTFSVSERVPNVQSVIGAVSFDGKEAGYLFERGIVGGMFRGKTLWGR